MKPIDIVQKELLPAYRSQDWWWRFIFKRIASHYARIGWRKAPLIAYPLMIEIELGLMRYYFYKDGWIGVRDRIRIYNRIVAGRLEGHNLDLNPDEYHEIRTLTDPAEILDYEMKQLIKDNDY